ncbi:hypothetical protein VA7868_03276 [Vibrio aerogenes CECT 7868]|uniref:Uncharacterized protein n=1 Tax=Vibrio aerogenes CECT 7868 TaxID=1216006 RepID=A0A1M5ZUX1_9VIBR|nr:hypothetical protein [Vibrio aerogenes]SHI28045.1 hypothetical protein VA7868_03276 [Vibrio aerogenes CECT 7868]
MHAATYQNKHMFLVHRTKSLSQNQFESVKAQLKLMTTSQLKSLQSEINESLQPVSQPVLTREELEMLHSLFR